MAAHPRRDIDWDAVEREYRTALRSLKAIGAEYGVSDAGIIKRAKRDGWERDLSERIRAKAEAKVSAALVSEGVSAQTKAADRDIVEANAEAIATAVLLQRRDVARGREIVQKLFDELGLQIDGLEALEQLGELMAQHADETGKLAGLEAVYRKMISLPSRIDSARKLAESLRVLIELERKVLRIRDDAPTLEDFGRAIGNGMAMDKHEAYKAMLAAG